MPNCMLCNGKNAYFMQNNMIKIFDTQNTLPSGSQLSDVLGGILDKKLQENKIHSSSMCKICLKRCTEYDRLQTKMTELKQELLNQFKSTLAANRIEYNNYESNFTPAPPRLVVSASKLQPLTPDMLLKVGKLPVPRIDNSVKPAMSSSTFNLRVTVGSSVLTQTITTTNTVTSAHTDSDQNDMLELLKTENDDDEVEPMHNLKINDDCSLSVYPVTASEDGNLVLKVEGAKKRDIEPNPLEEFLHVPALADDEDDDDSEQKYVLSNFEIMGGDDDDEEAQTIVLNGDNCSLLRVMNGQKLVYEGGEISFMMPDDDSQNGDQDAADDQGADSNDESQIELQVSGDEETANAIIAAATEQGGAFIKMSSGGMLRVKSIKSESEKIPLKIVEKKGKKFKCLICKPQDDKLSFLTDAQTMMEHLKNAHGARIYICRRCDKVLRKKSEYSAHLAQCEWAAQPQAVRVKRPPPVHLCPQCGKAYNSRTLLLEHLHTHSGARPHPCPQCQKAFSSKYTLQAHLKTHQDRPRPYKCAQCNRAFLTQQNLTQHEKTHSGRKDFECSACGKAFSTQHNLEVHAIVHSGTKAFVCTVCEKAFARRAELRDHSRTHTGERPFECDICGARFAQRSNLHSHKRATHMDDKRYHCTQCPKRFKRRRLLEYHIKGSHTGERPLRCDKCPAAFVYPEHYKKHIMIHSGERPFLCEICGKGFSSRDNRNTHRFTHSDKKPYECVKCGAGYMRKQLLYAHINASGHIAESIVVNQPRVSTVTDDTNAAATESVSETAQPEMIFEINDLEETGKSIDSLVEVSENNILESVSADQLQELGEQAESENGDRTVRLVPVRLPDGNDGWMALR